MKHAILPALLAVAFAGIAHRLDAPAMYTGVPSIDLGQLSSILAAVAAALYSVAQMVTAVRDFVEKWRNPPEPTTPYRARAAEEVDPSFGCSLPNCPKHPQP